MTDTERERLRAAAGSRMGWEMRGGRWCEKGQRKAVTYRGAPLWKMDWHPDTDLNQAKQVAETVGSWMLEGDDGRYFAVAKRGSPKAGYYNADNPAEALLIATIEAMGEGWRDE